MFRSEARRQPMGLVPFVLLVAAILAGGLIALLIINNLLAEGSFEQARLKAENTRLFEQEQAMREEVERLSSPAELHERARELGLVQMATIAYLDLATGRILGVPQAAGTSAFIAPRPPRADDEPESDDLPALLAKEGGSISDPGTGTTGDSAGGKGDGATISGGTAHDRAIVSGGGQ